MFAARAFATAGRHHRTAGNRELERRGEGHYDWSAAAFATRYDVVRGS